VETQFCLQDKTHDDRRQPAHIEVLLYQEPLGWRLVSTTCSIRLTNLLFSFLGQTELYCFCYSWRGGSYLWSSDSDIELYNSVLPQTVICSTFIMIPELPPEGYIELTKYTHTHTNTLKFDADTHRHSRVVQRSKTLHLSAQDFTTVPGSNPGCITSGCDWESHKAAHNWPIVVPLLAHRFGWGRLSL
jgi:hypothetical protein